VRKILGFWHFSDNIIELYVFFWVITRRLNSDAGVLPRRKHTAYRTRRKFEIKNILGLLPSSDSVFGQNFRVISRTTIRVLTLLIQKFRVLSLLGQKFRLHKLTGQNTRVQKFLRHIRV
jgi:hypothetical protein